ncbi:hypothetical protein GCM10009819_36190 [Agromyces tropicus]|uniref:DUF4349 domain-containing protein n=1 Tax=Agromyces tropicus TaxID=555371 RepID=A0ABN2UXF0_9MICO
MTSRRLRFAAVAALSALLLSGCSMAGGSSDSSADGGGVAPQPDIGAEAPADGGVAPRDEQPFTEGEQFGTIDDGRSVITTGWMTITVDDPVARAGEVASIVGRADGRVDSRSETPGTDTQQARATLVVRIPAERFDDVLADLRELGEVDAVQLEASDVTQQKQDLDSRIQSLQTSVDRLRTLLAQADDVSDLIAIESELTTRQAELDSLRTQRDFLADQVDYSTLTVELLSEGLAPEAGPNDFWSGVVAGWNALTGFVSGLLVAVGVLLPWIAVLAVGAAIVVGIVVLATRRRHPGDGSPTAGADGAGAPAPGTREDAAPTPGPEGDPSA